MKKFLAIYIGSDSRFEAAGWGSLTAEERHEKEQAGMKGWGDWVSVHQSAIVDMGGPLGKTKSISKQGVADIKNQMMGYTIIEAETHDVAAQQFINHPHFTLFPGDSVEVMECLPIPTA